MPGKWNNRERVGAFLGGVGLIVLLAPVLIYLFDHTHPTPDWRVLLVGGVIGMAGFFLLDPKGAKDYESTVTGSVVAIVGAVPTLLGRRKTDPVAVPVPAPAPAATVAPAPAPAPAPASAPVTVAVPRVVKGAGGDEVVIVPGVSTGPLATDNESDGGTIAGAAP